MENTTSTGEPKVKGAALIGVIKYVKGQPRGEELLESLFASLPSERQPLFKKKVLTIAEYHYGVFVDFLKTMDKLLGSGDLSLCREFGRFAATQDFQYIYNMYKKRANPKDLRRDSSVVWKSYYVNAGRMETDNSLPGHLVIRIHDFPEMGPAHCRLMEGWISQAVVETRGSWIEEVHEVKCNSKGDPHHEFVGRWKDWI